MCSFLFTSCPISLQGAFNHELVRRGPDFSNLLPVDDYFALHNLLSITGDFTPQPLSAAGVTLLFNGEVYNYAAFGDYRSDGPAILDGYLQEGVSFFQHLEGEYAILIYDGRSGEIIAVTDTFGTKPFWFGSDGENFAFASLASAVSALIPVKPIELPPNTITVYSVKTLKIKSRVTVTHFDLRQGTSNLDDWCIHFESAVKTRARLDRIDEEIFIGLSTGYDSGAIAAALRQLARPFLAFSIVDPKLQHEYFERTEALNGVANHYYIRDTRAMQPTMIGCEPYDFSAFSMQGDYAEASTTIYNDSGARGLWVICEKAHKLGLKVYLSGSGADEIISDYGFQGQRLFAHSNFGGMFPDNLGECFPWASFFGSTMRSYLRKEEYVAGHFGIEGRYPFLDRNVVQAYLGLDVKVKNGVYKAPIDYYLSQAGFPCRRGVKYGF